MTVQTDIIVPAYRESNYKAIGATPTDAELAEALVLLQALTHTFFGLGVGTKLKQWWVPWPQLNATLRANYPQAPGDSGVLPPNDVKNPPANTRLMVKVTDATEIFFQYQPDDGALMEFVDVGSTAAITLNANGQLFGLTGSDDTLVITPDWPANRLPTRRWVYRADRASWVEIEDLSLTGELPFPVWFNDYFITELALRLAPRFGNDPRASTLARNSEMNTFVRGQYQQMGIEIVGEPGGYPSFQTHDRGDDFARGGSAFEQGNTF